jgi:hypothetical protein
LASPINKKYQEKYKKLFVYFKTDIIPHEEEETVRQCKYQMFDIFRIYGLLKKDIPNDIYHDFYNHIARKRNAYCHFEKKRLDQWTRDEEYGFLWKLASDIGYFHFGIYKGTHCYFKIIEITDYLVKGQTIGLQIESDFKNAANLGMHIKLFYADRNLAKAVFPQYVDKFKKLFAQENDYKEMRITRGKSGVIMSSSIIAWKGIAIQTNGYINYQAIKEKIKRIKTLLKDSSVPGAKFVP